MKCFLFAVAWSLTSSVVGQPLKEKIKAAIEKIEIKDYSTNGEVVTSINIAIINYSVIPLRDWWKYLMNAHLEFGREMDTLRMEAKQDASREDIDSTEKKNLEEALKALSDSMTKAATSKNSFNYVAYFKKKYEQTPPSIKAYEVHYQFQIETSMRRDSRDGKDFLRRVLSMEDLSEVKSF